MGQPVTRNPDNPLYDPNDEAYSDDEELGYLGLTVMYGDEMYGRGDDDRDLYLDDDE